jgi:hypothetical protein
MKYHIRESLNNGEVNLRGSPNLLEAEARPIEEPGARKLHAGILRGGNGAIRYSTLTLQCVEKAFAHPWAQRIGSMMTSFSLIKL